MEPTTYGLEVYRFQPRRAAVPGYLLVDVAAECSEGRNERIEWGYSTVSCSDGVLEVSINGAISVTLDSAEARLLREDYMYMVTGKGLIPIEVRRPGAYMRLHNPRGLKTPTLIINGIHMHRIVGMDPVSDARAKVAAARVKRGHVVLDVCTGLGYTAIASLERGASRVYTIEVSREVLALAELNPSSKRLADRRAVIILGDASQVIGLLPDNSFDRVIHDPPRFNVAGELYSSVFYREIYRVLKPGGVLFHYTGEPMKTRGHGRGPIVRGVVERLRAAGFTNIHFNDKAQGVVARKPRSL
ncbi:hypothetical protein CF15_02845 [Pyrodictium occultum]|uniref:Methyltransferase domain-containing protein n=1 Tax=Pyrodictium occultum TaxID=2309 RepID=A0A0V8RUU8_PYROC|nr:methyltransferase domain-containing protein [Pyrodictium occultum]KSW11762.1 hypothetical protein CF15_02845 [Pyrodictium occultum]